jgi:hypothetical protein
VRVSLRPIPPIRSVSLWSAALAVLLAVALLCASGLLATPAASASPSATQIDDYLAAHSSPMTGEGQAFVAAAQRNGIDPAFLVAICGAETSFGRFLYSEGGDQCTYNAFNWFYGATWPQSDFASWSDGIGRVAQGLAGDLYYGSGLYSVQAIAPRYCPDGTANWVANVTSFMIQLGGNPTDTRAAAVYGPASSDPSLLGVDGSVRLSGAPFAVGRQVTARFTLTNVGDQPVALDGIQLMTVDPRGVSSALVSDEPVTLAPGQQLAVAAVWPLDTVGRWSGWIEVVQNGQVNLIGEKTAFTFRVTLPRDALVRRWVRADQALSMDLGTR